MFSFHCHMYFVSHNHATTLQNDCASELLGRHVNFCLLGFKIICTLNEQMTLSQTKFVTTNVYI